MSDIKGELKIIKSNCPRFDNGALNYLHYSTRINSMPTVQKFHIPQGLSEEEQIIFLLSVVIRHREELVFLRRKNTLCQRYHNSLLDMINEWKEKYKIQEKENNRLQEENEALKKEIAKLTKTNERYRVALFDRGNLKRPTATGKKKGGQHGHINTNKDQARNYQSFSRQRIFNNVCECGSLLDRTNGLKTKILLDIDINPKALQIIVESERQWCKNCHKEVRAVHPQSLPFTEYGINTLMVTMYLRFKGNQSVRGIANLFNNVFGLPITKSGVASLLKQAKIYLREKYEQLKQAIRDGDIMYNDETGWSVAGKLACMWIMVSPDKTGEYGKTVYVAAESKGKGIFKDMYGNSKATSMHDGNPSYQGITGIEKTAYCWSHVTRFAYEETVKLPPENLACQIRDRIVNLYKNIREHPERSQDEKEAILRAEFDSLLYIQTDDQTAQNILNRIKTQKEGLILALLITEDGTNNLAEREFRQLVIARTISYGSDTYGGMETTAVLASIVKTISRDKTKPFLPTLKSYLKEGIQNHKNPDT